MLNWLSPPLRERSDHLPKSLLRSLPRGLTRERLAINSSASRAHDYFSIMVSLTVTLFARLRGRSTSQPRKTAM